MSPSPNQFPQSSSGSDQPQTNEPVIIRRPNPPKTEPTPKSESTPKNDSTPEVNQADSSSELGQTLSPEQIEALSRHQPIPPPSEPLQYRAIGLVRGKYTPSDEQFTKGMLLASDGRQIDAVLLGRVMSLVKNHLDLAAEHLWVVYPRTRQEQGDLHFQIVGVWEPEKLDKERTETDAPEPEITELPQDGYFSIRGEVVFQLIDEQKIVVKIKQAPRKESDKPKFFKLTLKGLLEKKAVGYFWDLQVQRDADSLLIKEGKDIASLRPKKPGKGRPGGKPGGKKPWKKGPPRPRSAEGSPAGAPRPIKPGAPKPNPGGVTPKPTPRPKRQQPSGESGQNNS